jgi:hypothetical protein
MQKTVFNIFSFFFSKVIGSLIFCLFCTSFVYAQTEQIISFPDIPVKGYGDTTFTLNAVSSSGLPITYVSSNTAVATVTNNVVTIKATGDSFISAFQNGNGTYAAALPVPQLLVVCPKATLTVMADDKTMASGNANPTLTYTITGYKKNETVSVVSGTPVFAPLSNNNSSGTYPIVINRNNLTATNYEFMMEDGVLTVNTSVTTWNGSSWSNGVPTSAMEAIIEGNYTTSATPGNGTFTAKKLTINSGTLTVVTGTNLTVVNELINNAGSTAVIIENNANLIQTNDIANTGAITVKRNSNPLKRLDYTMWSSPTGTTQTLSNFSPLTSSGRFYEYDSATDLYSVVPPSTTFSQAKGFLIRMPNENNTFGYNTGDTPIIFTGIFTGIPNNGTIRISGTPGQFLATGNPYPSAINADLFINSNIDSGGTGTLYFWRKTNNINQRTNPSTSYATYTKAGAVVSGSGSSNDGYIPTVNMAVGQGFITAVPSSGQLVFTNSMRSSSNTLQVLKLKSLEKSRVWINLLSGENLINQMMIAYIDKASKDVDVYDGKYIGDSPTALSSEINKEEYVIQARGLPFDASDVINLNFKTTVEGEYTITKDHVDGLFAKGQDVYLVDKSIGKVTNLQTDSYKFTTPVGTYNDRFQLVFKTNINLSFEKAVVNEKAVLVNKQNGILNINAGTIMIKNVKIFDMMGRLILEQKELNTPSTSIKNLGDTQQVLIVKITTSNDEIITKKIIN